ncbi:MAG: helix-turn-helix domain-containing protein [Methylococcaceae bacterium]
MTIGSRLKQWRIFNKLNQDEASTKLNIPFSTFKKYEMDTRNPGAEAMEAFVNAGINANWLLTGTGPMLVADYSVTTAPAAASELTEPMQILDTNRLQLAIETIEEALTKHRRGLRPAKKAEAIKLAYQIYEEEDKEKDRAGFDHASKILNRLIKSMA